MGLREVLSGGELPRSVLVRALGATPMIRIETYLESSARAVRKIYGEPP